MCWWRRGRVTEFVQYAWSATRLTFPQSSTGRCLRKPRTHEGSTLRCGTLFSVHPDPEVNKLASELMSDRYQLSKIHAKILGEEIDDKHSRLLEKNLLNSYVPRATTELKNFYVLQKIEELKKEMKSGNKDDYVTLITQLKQLQEIRKVLAKELGERIVLKY